MEILVNLQKYAVGRTAVIALNYYYRKTLLHLLEQRDNALSALRELEQLRLAENSPTSSFNLHTSPETVHGPSPVTTPHGYAPHTHPN